jgi:tetratricopeptide (TPR) repeat protein
VKNKYPGKIIILIPLALMVLAGCGKLTTQKPESEAHSRGTSLVNRGMYDQAIVELNNAIQINPNSDSAYYDRGRAWSGKGYIDKAISDYTKAIEINSAGTIQVAYNNRGQEYEKRGDIDQALSDYTKGIEAVPNPSFSGFRMFKATLLINRLNIYISRKEYDKAWKDVDSIRNLGFDLDPKTEQKLRRK